MLDLTAVTLFVADVGVAREFYERAFDLPVFFSDDESVVFRVGPVLVNLLVASAAGELVEPAAVGAGDDVRAVYTVTVDDVDATCAGLASRGIALLNGPVDRPWGVRTASFRDPDGHVWEVAAELASGSLEAEGE